jgi:signal transduction histidine kinase
LARYFIGLPGGLLAAYGLREQTYLHIAPLEAPDIVSTLRLTGIALALYSIFEGLLPPPVPFFPGNILNSDTFEQVISVPALVFLSLIGLIMAVATIRALEIFDRETDRRIEAMEQQQILLAERQRIARELHDGAIQTVYTAGLLVESAQKQAPPGTPIANRLEKAVEVLQDAILDLRRNLNTLNTQPAETSLADALERIAADPRYQSMVKISLDLNLGEGQTLSDRQTSHILAIVNEAISNVIRHAHARNVWISARQVDGSLNLSIMDDGSGMNGTPSAGYGLRNMRDRARLLGGDLEIKSESGRGTRISLSIPCIEE